MKRSNVIAVFLSLALVLGASTVFAEAGFNVSVNASANVKVTAGQRSAAREAALEKRVQKRVQTMQNRGDKEVQNRVNVLSRLLTRIQNMRNLSDSEKAAFSASVQAQITDMTNLVNKLQSDMSTTTLRADLQTIAPDYRIYVLVMPQISLLSAVDRVNALVASLQTIQGKVQARVSGDASLSGNTIITGDFSDMTAKLSDASAQAAAAQSEVINLKPDQGDRAVTQSNIAALKDARTKIKTAMQDLYSARTDARAIVKIIIQGDRSLSGAGSTSADAAASSTTTH